MKSWISRMLLLAAFSLAVTGLSFAQEFAYRVTADIPNDFYVGDQHFAAGSYVFAVNCGDHAVTITNQASRRSSVILATSADPAPSGKLTTERNTEVELKSVGGRYQLAEISTPTNAVEFPNAGVALALDRHKYGAATIDEPGR